jgi:hypothetical protein
MSVQPPLDPGGSGRSLRSVRSVDRGGSFDNPAQVSSILGQREAALARFELGRVRWNFDGSGEPATTSAEKHEPKAARTSGIDDRIGPLSAGEEKEHNARTTREE